MDQVILICLSGSGSLPEVEVQPFRYGGLFTDADGFTVVGVPGLGVVGSADDAVVEGFDGLHDIGPGTPLVTHLQEFAMFFGRSYKQFSFVWIVAAWFFEVYMFPGGHGQQRSRGVPVIRCGHDQEIQVLVFQCFPEVFFRPGFFLLFFFHCGDALIHCPAVHITHVHHLTVCLAGKVPGHRKSAAVHTHDGSRDLFIGTQYLTIRTRRKGGEYSTHCYGCCCGSCMLEK